MLHPSREDIIFPRIRRDGDGVIGIPIIVSIRIGLDGQGADRVAHEGEDLIPVSGTANGIAGRRAR